jgi:uncharacterized protein with PIN domain
MPEDCHKAHFRFYEELNDFLPQQRRKQCFAQQFRGSPAIKDTIEAVGVPHTEIDLILVNGQSVGFDYRLQPGDRVSVYPVFEALDIEPVTRLRQKPLRGPRFICDVHLGRLARRLRLLGFDVAYRNDFDDPDIVNTALDERRIILTCDRGILKIRRVTHGYFVRSRDVSEQVIEVLQRLDLASRIEPFTRCTGCNGLIRRVQKAAVLEQIPPNVGEQYDDYFRCESCGKVYWKGSHFDQLRAYVAKVSDALGRCR